MEPASAKASAGKQGTRHKEQGTGKAQEGKTQNQEEIQSQEDRLRTTV